MKKRNLFITTMFVIMVCGIFTISIANNADSIKDCDLNGDGLVNIVDLI